MMKDLAILIVNRNRADLTDALVEQLQPMGDSLTKDIYVIEAGSSKDNYSKHATWGYEEPDFQGKANAHIKALDNVRSEHGEYRYYLFLMNDLVFSSEPDPLETLVALMDANPSLGLLSPTESSPACYWAAARSGQDFHLVSHTDYLALLVRGEAVETVGFFKPGFIYSWGASQDYANRLYRNGYSVGYCDKVVMKHLGGTTYGATKNTISRDQYQDRAKQWCHEYFLREHGPNWVENFSEALPEEAENFLPIVAEYWSEATIGPVKRFGKKVYQKLGSLIGNA